MRLAVSVSFVVIVTVEMMIINDLVHDFRSKSVPIKCFEIGSSSKMYMMFHFKA